MSKNHISKPYKLGDQIKVYLSEKPGVGYFTTGIVSKVPEEGNPSIKYKDLSHLPLRAFNRLVRMNEVELPFNFKPHLRK